MSGEGFFRLDLRGTEVRWGAGKSCREEAEEAMVPDQVNVMNVLDSEKKSRRAEQMQTKPYQTLWWTRKVPTLSYVSLSTRSRWVRYEDVPGSAWESIVPLFLSASHRAFTCVRDLKHAEG